MSWKNLPLSYFAVVTSGGGAPQDSAAFSDTGHPFVRAGSLVKLLKGEPEHSLEKIAPEIAAEYGLKLFPAGSVLFAKSGMSATKGHIYSLKCPAYVVNHLAVLIPHKVTDGHYLQRVLEKISPVRLIQDEAYPSIRLGDIENMLIPAPLDADERRRIAAILDKADEVRVKRRQALEKLEGLAQAVFVEMFGEPGKNPKKFKPMKLGDLIDFVGGSQPPKSTFSYEPSDDTVRLIQIRDFKSDRFKTYIPKKLARRIFAEDDVMIARYGPPVFQILRGLSGSYNVALMKALPKADVTKDFIYYLLKEEKLHSYVVDNSERTAGQSGVNLELLEKYPAFLPPRELQIEFSEKVNVIHNEVMHYKKSLDLSEQSFLSLQQRAFRGEL